MPGIDLRVDVCGMCCPMPLIELSKTVQRLQPGQAFEIIGNDPLFESAVRNFCATHGHHVLQSATDPDHTVRIHIEVGGRGV